MAATDLATVSPAVALAAASSGLADTRPLLHEGGSLLEGECSWMFPAFAKVGGIGALWELAQVPVHNSKLAALFNVCGRGGRNCLAGEGSEEDEGELHVEGFEVVKVIVEVIVLVEM